MTPSTTWLVTVPTALPPPPACLRAPVLPSGTGFQSQQAFFISREEKRELLDSDLLFECQSKAGAEASFKD